MFFGANAVIHMMQHTHRFSISVQFSTRTVAEAISSIESRWFAEFWAPQFIRFDLVVAHRFAHASRRAGAASRMMYARSKYFSGRVL